MFQPYECSPLNKELVYCDIGNPLINTTGDINFVFKPSNVKFDKREIEFVIWANTSSVELTPQRKIIYTVEVIKKAEISIKG